MSVVWLYYGRYGEDRHWTESGTRRSEIKCHENGTRREFRDFLCGALIQYIPAASKESWAVVCREKYDPDVVITQSVAG